MAEGKDLAWMQWAICGAALLAGVAAGTWVVAPMLNKEKSKKETKKETTQPKK
ncbi:MAG: hypothetical protein JXQ90_18475 [Cyclobacteriaceae bacterium]